jgi:hypothetical protein
MSISNVTPSVEIKNSNKEEVNEKSISHEISLYHNEKDDFMVEMDWIKHTLNYTLLCKMPDPYTQV